MVQEEKIKVAILLHVLGEDALEVYNMLNIDHDEVRQTVEEILAAFRSYRQPKENTVFERHKSWAHPITIDVTELKQKSKDCEFGASENDMIRDKIVLSMIDQHLKERLLREPNPTLEKAIDACRATWTARAQIQAMSAATQERAVHAVHKKKHKDSQPGYKGRKTDLPHKKVDKGPHAKNVGNLTSRGNVQHMGYPVTSVESRTIMQRCVDQAKHSKERQCTQHSSAPHPRLRQVDHFMYQGTHPYLS